MERIIKQLTALISPYIIPVLIPYIIDYLGKREVLIKQWDQKDVIRSPRGIAYHQGQIYIGNDRGNDVQVFDTDGHIVRIFRASLWDWLPDDGGCFSWRAGLHPDEYWGVPLTFGIHGDILLVQDAPLISHKPDPSNPTMIRGDVFIAGRTVQIIVNKKIFRSWKLDMKEEVYHRGLAVSRHGLIYVVDRKQHCIRVYDLDGQPIRRFGSFGTLEGEFKKPGRLAITHRDELFVVDRDNHRVQVFDLEGHYLRQLPNYENFSPFGITASPEDLIYVTDPVNSKVLIYQSIPDIDVGNGLIEM
jgi:DNA-binding beta-propeller fold protein YncE